MLNAAALWDARGLVNGLELQFLHQRGGHPGCEDTVPSVWFHGDRRYASEVAAYDELQRAADVVATVEPTRALSFRRNLLPQWGVAGVPLRGELVTGPRVTVYDLREGAQGGG